MKYMYEFIGTFFLILTVGLATGITAPLAIGSILAVMVFAGGHISGAHYNPAVSLAVFIRGKLTLMDMFAYWAVQFAAGIIAAFLVIYMRGDIVTAQVEPNIAKAFIGEFLFTFALCFVVLNVATDKHTENNSYFGLAIGFTVLAGAYAVGTISGGAFNPAVAVGITIMKLSHLHNLWMFFVANLAGAATAAFAFNAAHHE